MTETRTYCYGYRLGEQKIPKWQEVKEGVKFRINPEQPDLDKRTPVQISLGCHAQGVSQPHPDPDDPATMLGGVLKRFARKPPKPAPGELDKIRRFVREWCRANLSPLSAETDLSFETWLASTNYPLWRKLELRAVWEEISLRAREKRDSFVKSFMKDETYPAFKHARGINARVDAMKVKLGPIFKAIENVVYKYKAFIKHIPVAERPRYIYELLYREGATYIATDFESFEALFTEEIMNAIEFELYDYMTQYVPDHREFMEIVREVLGGKNKCLYKAFVVWLRATRMSGEMCTSLGNGFSNLMLFLYVSHKVGFLDPEIAVEGDDGVASGHGQPPTAEDYRQLGMVIKLEVHQDLSEASFCGLIFDPEDLVNVTDPLDVLATFGWTSQRYARSRKSKLLALLRCKSLSLAHQYPGCPIISALAQYGLRMTRGYDVRYFIAESPAFNWWERNQLIAALSDEKKIGVVPPPIRTRLLVERKFGIPVETQLMWERYLDDLKTISPLDLPNLSEYVPPDWILYYLDYSQERSRLDVNLFRPGQFWPIVNRDRIELLEVLKDRSTGLQYLR